MSVNWPEETWQKVRRADLRSAKRQLGRAESRLNVGSTRSRSIEASVSRRADRASTGLDIKATLAEETRFHGGTGRFAGKPHGGAIKKVRHDSVSGRKAGTGAQMLNATDRPGVFNIN